MKQQGEVLIADGCLPRDAESWKEEVWEGEGAGGRRGLSLELEVQGLDLLIWNLPLGQESEAGGLDVTSRCEMDSLFHGQENERGSALLDLLALGPWSAPSKSSCCVETLDSKRMHSSEVLECRQMPSGLKKSDLNSVTPAWLIVNVTRL